MRFLAKSAKSAFCLSFIVLQVAQSPYAFASFIDAAQNFSGRVGEIYARNRSIPLGLEIPVTTVLPSDPSKVEGLENVIYSIGLEQTEENRKLVAEEWKVLKSKMASKDMAPSRRRATQLQVAKIFGVIEDEAEYQRQIEEVQAEMGRATGEDSDYAHYDIDWKLDEHVRKAISQAKMKWIYKGNATVETVYRDLSQGKVKNAIFIFHGDKYGNIYDVDYNIFPPTFFYIIKPSLRSMAFFSCHGDEIISRYHLNHLTTSYYDSRPVFIVPWSKKNNPDGQTINRGIPKFVSVIDQRLLDAENTQVFGRLKPEIEMKDCRIDIKDFISGGDLYIFHLNKQFIGATTEKTASFHFNCDVLHLAQPAKLIVNRYHKDGKYFHDVDINDQTLKVSLFEENVPLVTDFSPINFPRRGLPPSYILLVSQRVHWAGQLAMPDKFYESSKAVLEY